MGKGQGQEGETGVPGFALTRVAKGLQGPPLPGGLPAAGTRAAWGAGRSVGRLLAAFQGSAAGKGAAGQ